MDGGALAAYLRSNPPPQQGGMTPEMAAQHAARELMGFNTEGASPFIPPVSMPFIRRLTGAQAPPTFNGAFHGLPNQDITQWAQLPDQAKIILARAQPNVAKLGLDYDYEGLAKAAENLHDRLPPDLYNNMAATAAMGMSAQSARANRASVEGGLVALNEAGHQATFGIVPRISDEALAGADLSPEGVSIARAVGAVAGIGLQGELVVGGLGMISKLPSAVALTAQVPQRVKEVMFGMGAAAIMDAARPEGLPQDPAHIDIPARIAKPISDALGGGPVADRIGLAVGGGITGGIVGEVLGPIVRGINKARMTTTADRMAQTMTVEDAEAIRNGLAKAGVPIATNETYQTLAMKALQNLDRISQSERMASVVQARLTREDYIMNQLFTDPDFVSATPSVRGTKAVGQDGRPVKLFRGILAPGEGEQMAMRSPWGGIDAASSPQDANFFTAPTLVKEQEGAKTFMAGGRPVAPQVQPVYMNLKNPLNAESGWDGAFKGDVVATIVNNVPEAERAAYLDALNHSISPSDFIYQKPEAGPLVRQAAEAHGFDGIASISTRTRGTMYTAFNENQVVPAYVSEEGRYLAAVFRTNPGGLTVAKDIADRLRPTQVVANPGQDYTNLNPKLYKTIPLVQEMTQRMGLNVHAYQVGNDILMFRPQVTFPEVPVPIKLEQNMKDFTEYVQALNRGRRTTSMSLLPDGSTVRGEYQDADIAARYKFKPPVVDGSEQPGIAVREGLRLIKVQIGDHGNIAVSLPSNITKAQVNALGSFADLGIPNLTLTNSAGKSLSLQNPMGIQVQDALGELIDGASRPKLTAQQVSQIQQYQKEGVFAGQAATTPEGYPVEIVRRLRSSKADLMMVRDPMTGQRHNIPTENLTVLQSSLDGELQPSNMFMQYLSPGEQQQYARLRQGIMSGYAEPIKNFHDLEEFASSVGRFATSMRGGRVALVDAVTGERMVYDNYKAAVNAIKETTGALPDLTPPDVVRALGIKPNFGGMGGNFPPARMQELVPMASEEFEKYANSDSFGQLVPGALQQALTPTRGLMLDLSKQYNLPFFRVFDDIQTQITHRENFVSAWIRGDAPGLPEGVMPLKQIMGLAGRGANQEAITAYLEAEGDAPQLAAITAGMQPGEIQAAQQLRKWYNGLFDTFGIERDYINAYAPHFRQTAEQYGGDLREAWRATKGTNVPKGVDFFADYARDGVLDLYEQRAFVAASHYLGAGAANRFMKPAITQARTLLEAIPDNAVKMPLNNYLEAISGREFAPQKAALDATVARTFQNLGMSPERAKEISEKFTMSSLGLVYTATMGFRPGPVLRNLGQILQTTWPMYGLSGDQLSEAIGRALTTGGRDEAILDGAISVGQGARFAAEDIEASMPKMLNAMSDAGFRLYDGADMLNRAVAYWASRIKSEQGLQQFANDIKAGVPAAEAQANLIKTSGAFMFDKPIVDEYLRRATQSPERATSFLGKQAADVTQFLYGRGNQPRWMRSVPGRFFGQFGTWPLWFLDYVRRTTTNMISNGYKVEAIKFLGKLALADAAIYYTGKQMGLDLRKWMAGNSLFYTGGPAVEVVTGGAQLMRGLGEEFLSTYDSPATKQRVQSGLQTLERTGRAFVPYGGVVNDLAKLYRAQTPTERLAAVLGTVPSTDYTVQQRLDMLTNPGVLSSDQALRAEGANNGPMSAAELMRVGMQMAGTERPGSALRAILTQPPGSQPAPAPQQGVTREKLRIGNFQGVRGAPGPAGRPPMSPNALPDYIKNAESRPFNP